MKNRIHIFNPEHDLALAFGGENYTAPPLAQALRRNLQCLPAWIASSGDVVMSLDSISDNRFLESLDSSFGIGVKAVSPDAIPSAGIILPWGWDYDLRKRLFSSGAPFGILPAPEQIDAIRRLSHRRLTINVHNLLREIIPEISCHAPCELYNFNDIHDFAISHPDAFMKAPWSSSGKGIFRALDSEAIEFERWCRGILRRQGSVLCERPLSPVLDFALEYSCINSVAQFSGYSIFHNDAHRSFDSGEVMAAHKLHHKISVALADDSLLDKVKDAVASVLSVIVAPFYSGPLGVDMLVYSLPDGSHKLNPCIEVNIRNTMGIVTSTIGNRFIHPESHGSFKIEYHKHPIPASHISFLAEKHPLVLDGHKIIEGFQLLTPLYPDSRYCAYIIVNRD